MERQRLKKRLRFLSEPFPCWWLVSWKKIISCLDDYWKRKKTPEKVIWIGNSDSDGSRRLKLLGRQLGPIYHFNSYLKRYNTSSMLRHCYRLQVSPGSAKTPPGVEPTESDKVLCVLDHRKWNSASVTDRNHAQTAENRLHRENIKHRFVKRTPQYGIVNQGD